MFQIKVKENYQITYFMLINFFPQIVPFMRKMEKTTKLNFAFPLQQLLHELAIMLRHTYASCPVKLCTT